MKVSKTICFSVMLGISPCFGAIDPSTRLGESTALTGVALAVLVPVHCNVPFMSDLVKSLSCAAGKTHEEGAQVFTVFRVDDDDSESRCADMAALNHAIEENGLQNYFIKSNKYNVGCAITRRLLLGDLINLFGPDSALQKAVAREKLYWIFIDNDDVVHSCLFRNMLSAAVTTGALIVNGEYLIQVFDRMTIDRIQPFRDDFPLSQFNYVERNYEDEGRKMLGYDTDGKRICSGSTRSMGYVPVLFKYNPDALEELFLPDVIIKHPNGGFFIECLDSMSFPQNPSISQYQGDTQHFFIEKHELGQPKEILLVLGENASSGMYFYRQHMRSGLHNLEKELPISFILNELTSFFEKVNTPQGRRWLMAFGEGAICKHFQKVAEEISVRAKREEEELLAIIAQAHEHFAAGFYDDYHSYQVDRALKEIKFGLSDATQMKLQLNQMLQQIRSEWDILNCELEQKRAASGGTWELGLTWE
ncbi:MAG: hypothetical protein LBI30_04000 [Holosporales bacterium]|nr:hypothetical protein [Holosporales bacterium]